MQPHSPPATRRRIDKLLIAVFLCALGAPWVDGLVRPDSDRSPQLHEDRPPAPKPVLTLDPVALWRFPEAYQSWFNDSLGLRDVLLRWHSLQSLDLLGVSPTAQVLLGKDGWYFYTGNESVPVWRGLKPFSGAELERWRLALESRRDWLRERNCEYVFAIVPNKETVYPDLMPDALTRLGPTRLDQFSEYMAQHSDLDVLDLRPAFAAARSEDTPRQHLYLEEGTHWNAPGTMAAYQAIVTHLGTIDPSLRPLPLSMWKKVDFDSSGDTWARKMYIEDLSPQRESGWMRPVGEAFSKTFNEGREGVFGPGRKLLRGTGNAEQPRAILFHDSFGPYLENLLAEHFSTLECCWTYDFDAAEVQAQKPRLVIELWVERALVFWDPVRLTPRLVESAQEEFERADKVCVKLDPTQVPAELGTVGKMRVSTITDEHGPALMLEQSTAADSLLLPELACPPVGRPVLHVVVDCPAKGNFDVLYLRPGDQDYSRQHNCLLMLEAGHNDVTVRMPEARVMGRLRLRPAYTPGAPCLLRAFEVRSSH